MRYVVGGPGTYAYFTDERPEPTAGCGNFDHWKYGFAGDLPPYVVAATVEAARALERRYSAPFATVEGARALERRYTTRLVIYLVGANDTDPNHRLLDKSCAAEAQGPTRLARMQFFVAEMLRRGAGLNQRVRVVEGTAHNEARVFGSPCGRAALFGDANCPED